MVGHVHLAAQHLLEAFFHLHRQGAPRLGLSGLLCGLCQLFAQCLGLTHVQLVVCDDLRRLLLQLRRGQAQDHLCVADIDKAAFQQFQHVFRQVQQAQAVGQCAAALAQLLCRLLLRQAAAGHQLPDAGRFFHRVQILALQVFHQSQLHGLLVADFLNDHRHIVQPCHAAGTPAALTRHDAVAAARARTHRDGLQQTMLCNAGRQLAQRLFVKGLARLFRVRFDLTQGQGIYLCAGLKNRGGIFKQTVQPAAKSSFSSCHSCSP